MKPFCRLAGADQSPCRFVDALHGAGIIMVGRAGLLLLVLCRMGSPMMMEAIKSKVLVGANFSNLNWLLFRLISVLNPLADLGATM